MISKVLFVANMGLGLIGNICSLIAWAVLLVNIVLFLKNSKSEEPKSTSNEE